VGTTRQTSYSISSLPLATNSAYRILGHVKKTKSSKVSLVKIEQAPIVRLPVGVTSLSTTFSRGAVHCMDGSNVRPYLSTFSTSPSNFFFRPFCFIIETSHLKPDRVIITKCNLKSAGQNWFNFLGYIRNIKNGLCLDAPAASSRDGNPVQVKVWDTYIYIYIYMTKKIDGKELVFLS
jgi:hypothetical protein